MSLVFRCPRCGALNRLHEVPAGKVPVCGGCRSDLDTSGAPAAVDPAGLDRAVASSPVPVLVDFWAPWCGPCQGFRPVLEAFARESAGKVVVLKLDTEEHQDALMRWQVSGVPTVALFSGGREVRRQAGALPLEALRRFVGG